MIIIEIFVEVFQIVRVLAVIVARRIIVAALLNADRRRRGVIATVPKPPRTVLPSSTMKKT